MNRACKVVMGWKARVLPDGDAEPGDEIDCGGPSVFRGLCFAHAEEQHRAGDHFSASEARRYGVVRTVHLVRRAAWHVQDTLYAVALAPVLACGSITMVLVSGSGLGPAFAGWALAALLAAPVSAPFAALGWTVGAVFRTGPIGRELDHEELAAKRWGDA